MIPLGQFRDTFIIAIDDEGVAIIDQHVAHERVLFERVLQKLTAGRLESQLLLVPMLLEVAPSAHQALVSRAAELDRLGFEIESFGGATIKVTAVPALLDIGDSSKALLALAEDLEGLDRGAQVQDALANLATVLAEAGMTMDNVVRITTYVTDMDAYLGAMRGLPLSASTLIGVSRLAYPDLMVEMEAIAVA